MSSSRSLFVGFALIIALSTTSTMQAAPAPWHNNLYLGGDGYWKQRQMVEVTNRSSRVLAGEPVSLTVGSQDGQIKLVSTDAKGLRVCDASGRELLWKLTSPQGRDITSGPIPDGAKLLIPVDCEPTSISRYYVYFDNPHALAVPDFLKGGGELINGGVEQGQANTPTGWKHDAADEQHTASWSTDTPHSGKRCLKLEVRSDAAASWISTRQDGLRLVAGEHYTLSAWVRTENVVGSVGIYIHVGNPGNYMVLSPMAAGQAGTNDWHRVSTEFTVPKDCSMADLGTLLYGTGTAWFDDISLVTTGTEAAITTKLFPPEKMQLTEKTLATTWPKGTEWCAPVKLFNFTDQPLGSSVVSVDIAGTKARMGRNADTASIVVSDGLRSYPSTLLGNTLLISGVSLPARNSVTLGLYVHPRAAGKAVGVQISSTRSTGTTEDTRQNPASGKMASTNGISRKAYEALLNSPNNLAKNPSLETGSPFPDGWQGGVEGISAEATRMSVDTPGLFGQHCGKIAVPASSPAAWVGWRQKIKAKPGQSYLCAVWMRSQQLSVGTSMYAHILDVKGDTIVYANIGTAISGDSDWTLLSGSLTIPSNSSEIELHLTTNGTGTLWHDGVVVMEVSSAMPRGVLTRPAPGSSLLELWQVNAIEKVFHEHHPVGKQPAVQITMAGNEKEPLQLALRSPKALADVRVVVDAPVNKSGSKLGVDVGMVGFVPVDYPTNYYQDTNPVWFRKVPQSPPACDGWAGMWPDPIYPRDHVKLEANSTQPIWITVSTPTNAAPGDYAGKVKLISAGKSVKELPFTVHLWGFSLPQQSNTVAIYDVRMGSEWEIPGQSTEQSRRQFWKFMADYRLCPDRIYPNPDIRYENGKVVADFTEYDKAAEYYLDVLHLPSSYMPDVFYLFGWGFPPDVRFGEKPYDGVFPYDGVDRRILRREFKTAMKACLKAYWDHVKQNSWDKKLVYYISDEPFYSQPATIAQMQALCKMIAEVDPAIPIYSSTWGHVDSWDGYLNLWGIGHYGDVPETTIKKLRADGARVRFTTDGQMCLDTPYCAIERLLPHYCDKYGVEGYEFWGANWLTYDPHTYGWHSYIPQTDTPGKSYFVRYPNGDGYIAYPGASVGINAPIPSIRMAQAREGVEDYEYLHLLRALIAQAKAKGLDTASAELALKSAEELVGMPSTGGRYSSAILPDPDAVFAVKRQLARAIEGLIKKM